MRKYLILCLLVISVGLLASCRRISVTQSSEETANSTGATDVNSSTNTTVQPTIPPGTKVTLTYWNPLTGADGSLMRQLVADFNREYEGKIEVTETFTNEIDYYTNLNLLVPMGKGPDVAIMHSYLVQSYANRGIIVPMEDYINTSGIEIKASDYISDVFNSLYFNSKLYGVPLDIHVAGIYYNKDLLDKYGLAVPSNRAELIAAAQTVQEGEKNSAKPVWGLPISSVWPSEWLFTTSLYQNNGKELDAEGNPGYDTPEGREALKSVTDLIHVYKLSPTNLQVDQDLFFFETGQALFHIQGSWMLNAMIESGINFGVIPLSDMFNSENEPYSKYIAARSHTFVIPSKTKTVSPEKKIAAMTFIKYMGDHSYVWASAGQIPASNIARAAAEYQTLPYLSGFGDVNNFKVAAQSPYYHEAYSPIYSRVTAALVKPDYDANALFTAAVTEARQLIEEAKNS